jgi:hypothetical protein
VRETKAATGTIGATGVTTGVDTGRSALRGTVTAAGRIAGVFGGGGGKEIASGGKAVKNGCAEAAADIIEEKVVPRGAVVKCPIALEVEEWWKVWTWRVVGYIAI